MTVIIQILAMALLLFLSYQDFRYRAISWWLIPFLFFGFSYMQISIIGMDQFLANFMLNVGFILFQMAMLTIYFSIKHRNFTNIINTYLGIGDVLFFIVLAAAFSIVNYIFFQILSLVFITIGFVLVRAFNKNINPQIPLAGAMSLILVIAILTKVFVFLDFYNDNLLLDVVISGFPNGIISQLPTNY